MQGFADAVDRIAANNGRTDIELFQVCRALGVEDHDLPQPGDVEIGQNIICPDGPRMVWSDISKADWPIVAAKLEQIALLLRSKARS